MDRLMACLSENWIFKSLALKTNALIVIIMCLLSLSAAVNAQNASDSAYEIKASQQSVHWLDYEDARALDSQKPVFVFAEMTFCSACKKMKKEVFVEQDIIDTLNNDFVPANMSTLGIFPNTLDDLMDEEGEPLVLKGSPGFVIIKDNQYSVFYGFQSADELRSVFAIVLNSAK
ncbi:MAG: hypothetical protein ACJAWT_000106 [Glaciecola sp.]|jgi:hypothetical protein